MSKLIDKRNGRKPAQYKALGKYLRKMRGDRPQKDTAQLFPSKTGGLTGCVSNWELGYNVPTQAQWDILKVELDLDTTFDELIEREEAQREIIGKKSRAANPPHPMWGDNEGLEWDETIPATPEAQALDGSFCGFQPKPAVEVILVAMKPLSEKTYIDQALANGKGITWLDDGRIPLVGIEEHTTEAKWREGIYSGGYKGGESNTGEITRYNQQGRFAPNLLCSGNVLDTGKITKSGVTIQPVFESRNVKGFQPNPRAIPGFNQHRDSGDFSRYFNLDAWAIEHLPESAQRTFPFMIVPKASKREKNAGLDEFVSQKVNDGRNTPIDNAFQRGETLRKNSHPCVKPIKLMSWLIAIGSRVGDIVLDPYCGSGATCIATAILKRRYVGIEIDEYNCDISRRRIKWHVKENLKAELSQPDLPLTGGA